MDLYWTERAERVIEEGELEVDELMKRMDKVYRDSRNNIKKEIDAFYGRFAKDNKLDVADVKKRLSPDELKSAKEEIKKYYDMAKPELIGPKMSEQYRMELRMQSAKAYMSRLEELKMNIENVLVGTYLAEDKDFKKSLSKIYENTYNKTSFSLDLQKGFGTDFVSFNKKKAERALKERWLGDNFSDRIWKNKDKLLNQLETTFLQGVVQGHNSNKIASAMAKNYGTSLYVCKRLARTESGHIMGQATLQSYKENNVQEYEYVATLDNRTSDVCKHLDGKVFKLKDAVEGINYPEMHPNCRSTTVVYFKEDEIDKQFEEAQRIARDNNGNVYYVPANTKYEDWKKMKEGKKTSLKKVPLSTPKSTFKNAKTIEEAMEFAKKNFCKTSGWDGVFDAQVDYSGMSVDNANEINKALEDVYGKFKDLPKLSGIKVVSPKSKIGKLGFSDAEHTMASYDPFRNGILLNKNILKDAKTFNAFVKESKEAYELVKKNADLLKGSKRELAEKYIEAGRDLVDGHTIKGIMTHELSHHVEISLIRPNKTLLSEVMNNMDKYAVKVSGYATTKGPEYLAESIASYIKGEKRIDPKLYNELEKHSKTKSSAIPTPKVETKKIEPKVEVPKTETKKSESKTNNADIEQRFGTEFANFISKSRNYWNDYTQNDITEELAKKLNNFMEAPRNVEECKKYVNNAINNVDKYIKDEKTLLVRHNSLDVLLDHWDDFKKDPRLKTQFETGTSEGALSKTRRNLWEKHLNPNSAKYYGFEKSEKDMIHNEYRPVYGEVTDRRHIRKTCAKSYGDCDFILNKEAIKDRTSFTLGNSSGKFVAFQDSFGKCLSVDNMAYETARSYNYFSDVGGKGKRTYGAPYIEFQAWGGIDLSKGDVTEIIIPREYVGKNHFDEFEELAKSYNITITFRD